MKSLMPHPYRAAIGWERRTSPRTKKDRRFPDGLAWSAASYQPMSLNNSNVRSDGTVTLCVRSSLMNGSINWFGVASVSQCDTDEPGSTGVGVYTNGRRDRSAPA